MHGVTAMNLTGNSRMNETIAFIGQKSRVYARHMATV